MSTRILVTGAALGIGAATVAELRARGCQVIGLDLEGDGELTLRCDVRDRTAVDLAVSMAVERLGGLDVLINNAGIGDAHSAGEPPDDSALDIFDVNMLGPWRVTAAALPALRASRGRVVNVASGLARVAVPLATAYSMSKRALVAYSDALRVEHGDAITVATVFPGYIRTDIHALPAARGVSLEGIVPAERVEDAVRAIVRAALGRPRRNLATTWWGGATFRALHCLPGAAVDRLVRWRFRRFLTRPAAL